MVNDKKRAIQKKIEQIKRSEGDYGKIVEEQKQKWLGWWQENKDKLQLSGSLPRQAFTMLLECLGINSDKIKVIYEDDKEITWWSFNFCPILEACKILRLDTREVCRGGYEEPVQALISCLNPNLSFSRNYKQIRPYTKYCEESIEWLTYLEDRAIRGSCVFERVKNKESPLFCHFKVVEDCGKENNNLSECTEYSILGDELIKWMNDYAGAGYASCLKQGIQKVKCDDGVWRTREEFFNPDIKGPLPLDIWERFYKKII